MFYWLIFACKSRDLIFGASSHYLGNDFLVDFQFSVAKFRKEIFLKKQPEETKT